MSQYSKGMVRAGSIVARKRISELDYYTYVRGFPGGASGKSTCLPMQETQVRSLGTEDPLEEEGMATHSSILARKIPRTEEPGGLQSIGSQRVGHD